MKCDFCFGGVRTVIVGFCAASIVGCASKNPPPNYPPAYSNVQGQPNAPMASISEDEMNRLRQVSPNACQHLQAHQQVDLNDVEAMTKAGFSPELIEAEVRGTHSVFHLTANDILALKQAGVRDGVLDFLMNTPNSDADQMATAAPGADMTGAPSPDSSATQTPPPVPLTEVQPPAPSADYVWVGGDWVWNGGWVWVGGRWAVPPYPGAIWAHGRWGGGPYRYRRGPGRWR